MWHPAWRKMGATLISATSLFLALAAPAGATDYPTNEASRSFSNGAAGWTQSSSFDGTCIQPVLCATVTNEYVGGGDANGSGYISSAYLGVAGVGAVGGTTTGVWEGPAFTYGKAGGTAGPLDLTISRRADVGQLLAVAGNSAPVRGRAARRRRGQPGGHRDRAEHPRGRR